MKSLGTQMTHIQPQDLVGAICDTKLTGFAIKFIYFNPSLSGHADPPYKRDNFNRQMR